MAQPQTNRTTNDKDGRPCIHMTDEDTACLQVHHRGDQPTGFLVSCVTLVRLPGFPTIQNQVDVYLTHSQAQELCDYFRSVL